MSAKQIQLAAIGMGLTLLLGLDGARAEGPAATSLSHVSTAWKSRERAMPSVTLRWKEFHNRSSAIEEQEGRNQTSKSNGPRFDQQRCWIHEDEARFHWLLPGDVHFPLDVVSRKSPMGDFQSVRLGGFMIGSVPRRSAVGAECRIDAEARTDAIVLKDGEPAIARLRGRERALDRHFGAFEQATVRAVAMAFRPQWLLPGELREAPEGLTETPLRISGHRGLKLGWRDRELEIDREIWLDIDRACTVCRSVARQNSRCIEEIDVQYAEESAGRSVVRGWTIVCAPPPDMLARPFPGQLDQFESVRAEVVELSARAPGDHQLRLSLPPESVVHDERDQSWGIVSAAGDRTNIPREAAMHRILELESSQSGSEWPFATGGLVVAAGLAIIFGRRLVRNGRRREQAEPASAPRRERPIGDD